MTWFQIRLPITLCWQSGVAALLVVSEGREVVNTCWGISAFKLFWALSHLWCLTECWESTPGLSLCFLCTYQRHSYVRLLCWWAASQAVWAADRNLIQVLTSALIQGMPHHVYDRAVPHGWKECVVACWKPYFQSQSSKIVTYVLPARFQLFCPPRCLPHIVA